MKYLKFGLFLLAISMITQGGIAQTKNKANKHPMLSDQNENVWFKLKKIKPTALHQKTAQNLNLSESEIYGWTGENWLSFAKTNYEYQGNLLTKITGTNFNGESYVVSYRTTLSYEGNDLVEEIYEDRNFETNQLENSTRYTYEYQILGDVKVVVNLLTYYWQGEWVLDEQVNLTYSNGVISGGAYTSVTFPEDNETFTVTSVNDSTFITSFIEVGGELVPDYREIYPNITPEVLFSTFFGLDTYEVILPNYLFEFEFPDVIEQSFISNE